MGFRVSDGRTSLAYIPDHQPTALGPGPDGIGEYHEAALDLARGVDLLIHDAHLRAEEVEAEGSFGHAAAEYAVRLGIRWRAPPRCAVPSPPGAGGLRSGTDPVPVRRGPVPVIGAAEGLTLPL